ncbi:MAG: HD domain-containing protein [Candidatus Pacebacteria bacterium]|nr:HD domain-containing protein [Candidatus Paceibacterota bacterium]NUM41790.1 HD domain-containing protein [Leptospiraceae bacterium]
MLVNAPDINYPLQKCPGGSSLFSIFPDGTYTPCPFLLDTSDNFNLGNILNEASEVISAKLRNFVSDIDSELKKLSSSTPTCLKCSERNNCGLGCYVLRVVHEQNYKKPSLRCKKIVENQLQLRNELSVEEESQIRKFVKNELERSDIAHKFDHIENVVALAKMIGLDEEANLRLVVPAAYFHDIVPRKNLDSMREHVKESYVKATKYLKKYLNFTSIEVDNVTDAIRCSAWESHIEGVKPETLEAKVLRDADWLDAMGARGIARVFGFAGFCKLDIGDVEYDPESPPQLKCDSNKPDPTPFYHFFSKLLWLKDNMLTERGKKEAETRHNFMVSFLKAYKSETQYIKEF